MARQYRLLLLVGLLALLGWPARELPGCAPAPPHDHWVQIDKEEAFIVWNPETQTEQFIRRASFNSSAEDFGFLVPTPSRPELSEVDSIRLFQALDGITQPKYDVHVKRVPRPLEIAPTSAPMSGAVQVIEEKTVAGMDAVILQADDPDSLGQWLSDHQYHFRPALRDWLEKYTSSKWFITAFKVSSDSDRQGTASEINLKAVRMTFQTDRPLYPYREPVDMRDERARHKNRSLRLYVASPQRMQGTVGDSGPWSVRTYWANPLNSQQVDNLRGLKLEMTSKSGEWWLTRFEDQSSPRKGTDELYLTPAADQSTVEPPRIPIEQIQYYDTPSQVAMQTASSLWRVYWQPLMIGAVGLGGLVFWGWRRRQRMLAPSP